MTMEKPLLAPAVLAEITRLGGEWIPRSAVATEIDGYPVPAALAQFLLQIRWPQLTYFSDEDSAEWVWLMRFGIVGWLDPEEISIQDHDGRTLFYFGEADGGNYLLVVAADDPNPSDPQVYKVDHDDPDQRLYSSTTLSGFLRELQSEAGN